MHIIHANILNADIGFYTDFEFQGNSERKSINGPSTSTNPIFLSHVTFNGGQAGIFIQNVPEIVIDQCTLVENEVLGALFESSDIIMNNSMVLYNGFAGVETIDSDILLKDVWIQGNGHSAEDGTGIYANHFSRLRMHHLVSSLNGEPCLNNHNKVVENKRGIFIALESHGDFGWYRPNFPQDRYGYNEIHSNTDYDIKTESFLNAQLTFWNSDLDGAEPNASSISGPIFYDPPAPLLGDSICLPEVPVPPDNTINEPEAWVMILQNAQMEEQNGNYTLASELFLNLSLGDFSVQIRKTGIKGLERVSRITGGATQAVIALDNILSQTTNNGISLDIQERKAMNMSYSSAISEGLALINNLIEQSLDEETMARLLYRQSILENALGGLGRVTMDEDLKMESIVDSYPRTTIAELIKLKSRLMRIRKQDNLKNSVVTQTLSIIQLAPNPFNPSTKSAINIPEPGSLIIFIYDIQGRRVKTLQKRRAQSGLSQIMWDGKNFRGEKASSGIYIFTSSLKQDNGKISYSKSQKGVLLK